MSNNRKHCPYRLGIVPFWNDLGRTGCISESCQLWLEGDCIQVQQAKAMMKLTEEFKLIMRETKGEP